MSPELSTLIQSWLAALGGLATASFALVGVAYAIFRYLGDKWLSTKFDERLTAYKHAQQKELERLRFEISTLMDRTVKLHQREFEVIPEAWAKLNDAFNAMQPIGLGYHTYPDVNRLTENRLESFISGCELEQWQKDELRTASDKTRYYIRAMMPINIQKADMVRAEFSLYLSKNGIFIPGPIKSQFDALDTLMWKVILERSASLRHPEHNDHFDKGLQLHEDGPKLLKALEVDVTARLWQFKTTEQV